MDSSQVATMGDEQPFLSILTDVQSWIGSWARWYILKVLPRAISIGLLEIEEHGQVLSFGIRDACSKPVRLTVLADEFWLRVILYLRKPFSESYMLGEITTDSLPATLELFINNMTGVSNISSIYTRLTGIMTSLSNAYIQQSRSMARLNASTSYDQSNELFKAFLSKEMMYSCALWDSDEGGIKGDLTIGPTPNDLEAAQRRKIHHVLRQARVRQGHRVLEVGTGWGGLAIETARTYGCEVDTLTLSTEQKNLAEERVREAGLQDLIRVHLLDYRDMPAEFEHAFDAFVGIEMMEHVGPKYYTTYFKLVDFALKSQNATAVISSSTFPEARYSGYQAEDFMRRYMWPGSCLPSATVLIDAAYTGSKGRLTLDRVENHAAHYPRTLRTWDRRLKANLQQDIIAQTHPALRDRAQFETLMRKWEYRFAYASAGFSKGYITCHMLTFIRTDDTFDPL